MSELVTRRMTGHTEEFFDAFRVVIVNGSRRPGKTTLLQTPAAG